MTSFETLWNNHPTIKGDSSPCRDADGKPSFDDQCAIRLGVCLVASGVSLSQFRRTARVCWTHAKAEGHVIAAEELAVDLCKVVIPGIGKVQRVSGKAFDRLLRGQSGIIFFKDYWARQGESKGRSGDHIDLWNGSRLTDWTTWLRIQAGISWDGLWSDFSKSKEVWFWPVM